MLHTEVLTLQKEVRSLHTDQSGLTQRCAPYILAPQRRMCTFISVACAHIIGLQIEVSKICTNSVQGHEAKTCSHSSACGFVPCMRFVKCTCFVRSAQSGKHSKQQGYVLFSDENSGRLV
jgi:hypothetical protein